VDGDDDRAGRWAAPPESVFFYPDADLDTTGPGQAIRPKVLSPFLVNLPVGEGTTKKKTDVGEELFFFLCFSLPFFIPALAPPVRHSSEIRHTFSHECLLFGRDRGIHHRVTSNRRQGLVDARTIFTLVGSFFCATDVGNAIREFAFVLPNSFPVRGSSNC